MFFCNLFDIKISLAVVIDRREDKNCDTGLFELAFKQVY